MRTSEAKQFAQQAGAHLVTIMDDQENEFIRQIVPPEASCRMGMELRRGQPVWITGEQLDYAPASAEMYDFAEIDGSFTWNVAAKGNLAPLERRYIDDRGGVPVNMNRTRKEKGDFFSAPGKGLQEIHRRPTV